MANVFTDLAHDLFSNNIDWFAKSLQIFVDHLYPHDEDNSESPLSTVPFVVNGYIKSKVTVQVPVPWTNYYYADCDVMYSLKMNDDLMNNHDYLTDFFTWESDDVQVPNYYDIVQEKVIESSPERLILHPNFSYPDFSLSSAKRIISSTADGCYFTMHNTSTGVTFQGQAFCNLFTGNNYSQFNSGQYNLWLLDSAGGGTCIILTDHDSAQTYYNTYNYNNEYHNYFDLTIGGGTGSGGGNLFVGGGAGGVFVGLAGAVGYADIDFALDSLFDDLNINGGDDMYNIDFPSYDEIKYGDRGDFYIESLHQYDQLPTAPTINGTIDLGDYPRVIGHSANTFLSFLPASLSALLCAVFIISIILDNLRGRR